MTTATNNNGIKMPEASRIAVAQYCIKNRSRYETAIANPQVANNDGYMSINSVIKDCYKC